MDRRNFLRCLGSCLAGGALLGPIVCSPSFGAENDPRAAMYAESIGEGKTRCLLCPNACVRTPGTFGKCHVRGNRDGRYYAFSYGRPCVLAMDPVEKCPLFHFQVAGPALSIATAGCNLTCRYCQNWQFSQKGVDETRALDLTPEQVIGKVTEYKMGAISFFYTEPTIYIEYMRDIATLAREAGIPTIMVTAGYINPEPLTDLLPLIDAFVVGLKGFSKKFYEDVIGGEPGPVLRSLKIIHDAGKHLEIVTLLLPTLNDDETLIKKGVDWICATLSPNVPLHFTRFTPQFQLKGLPTTPVPVLERARDIALAAKMPFVYTGNIPGHAGNHTICPSCGKTVIERLGFQVLKNHLRQGICPSCTTVIPGRWRS